MFYTITITHVCIAILTYHVDILTSSKLCMYENIYRQANVHEFLFNLIKKK